MDNTNLRVTLRGVLMAIAWAAVLSWACTIPLTGHGVTNSIATSIEILRAISFFTALAAPFEKARYGMIVGVFVAVIWVGASWLYYYGKMA